MNEKEKLEERKKELDTREKILTRREEGLAGEEGAFKTEKEEVEKVRKGLAEEDKKLVEKETELGKKEAVLDMKEKYLEAAKVIRDVTHKVKGIRNLVVVALIIGAAIGAGLWVYRIPAVENRITDKIIALDQKITAISARQASEYQFIAKSEKTGDEKGFVFDTKEMKGKVFTTGVPGGKNLYVKTDDIVEVALTDVESGVVLERVFKEVQPGDILNFMIKRYEGPTIGRIE